MTEENKAIARKVYEIVASGDLDRAKEIVDPDAPDNERPECPPEMETSRPKLIDAFREFATEVHTAFPDARIEVEDIIAEGDKVSARVAMSGTHQAEFQGIAPTGRRVQVRAIDIFRIANGKIVEHWGHGDNPADILREPERP
ncbi:MAG: ester cyclase [Actinomycetota bacterium]|nr:ester cyclase [Actinomycetota bacterium]